MSIPIPEIRLTFRELRFLRRSRRERVNAESVTRLRRLGLVDEVLEQTTPGKMPTKTGFCVISSRGIDFLVYRKSYILTKWIPYWITTALAVAALAVSIISLCK